MFPDVMTLVYVAVILLGLLAAGVAMALVWLP